MSLQFPPPAPSVARYALSLNKLPEEPRLSAMPSQINLGSEFDGPETQKLLQSLKLLSDLVILMIEGMRRQKQLDSSLFQIADIQQRLIALEKTGMFEKDIAHSLTDLLSLSCEGTPETRPCTSASSSYSVELPPRPTFEPCSRCRKMQHISYRYEGPCERKCSVCYQCIEDWKFARCPGCSRFYGPEETETVRKSHDYWGGTFT